MERVGRVLHDGHDGCDGRLPRGAPAVVRGQAFTLALVLVGVSTALYTFSAFATVVVEGGWSHYLEHWRDARMINSLSDHYVICGFGRIGSIVANEFKRQKMPYVVVDRNADGCGTPTPRGILPLRGTRAARRP